MKASCSQKDLLNALNIVNKAVNSNNTLPVLNNILIKAEEQKLFFSATNLELAITYHIEADVKKPGAITVPARLFSSYIALLSDKTVELDVTESLELHVNTATSNTNVKGINADEFPLIPEVKAEHQLKISSPEISTAISQTCFAAAINTARPALSGILFSVSKEELKLVGTDSFRLAEKKIKLPSAVDFEESYIVPSRTINELGKILEKNEDSDIEVHFSKNQILFVVGKAHVISRLIEGKFPDYNQIIPREHKTRIQSKIGDLSVAMRRASLFSRENNHSMRLVAEGGNKLRVLTDETRVGEEKAEIPVTIDGEENKISLNAQYLLDVLNTFGENDVAIDLIDKDSPAVVKSPTDENYLYLIMPLKTNS